MCSGIDLEVLRWRYNVDTDIEEYFSDAEPSKLAMPVVDNPAFLSVELLSVSQNVDINFANFSSELTVNSSRLQSEGVTSIICGEPETSKAIQVDDVNVIQENVPERPNGVLVTAAYESGSLMELIVSWNKQVVRYNSACILL